MTRAIPCQNFHWPLFALLALLVLPIGGCVFPHLIVGISPNNLALVPGDSGRVMVTTTEPRCDPEQDLLCVDTTGQVFDIVVQNLPDGVTHSIDTNLQSPSTPGVVRITFEASASAVPGVYSVVVHAVLAGRSLGGASLALDILPATTTASATAVGIAAGAHSLAALADGSVRAWGPNDDGQLGDGSRTPRAVPAAVRDLDGIVDVAASKSPGSHSLVLTANGVVWAWGLNGDGQLGDGTRTDRLVPVRVQDIHNVQAIAANAFNSLALRTDGTVWQWGQQWGQHDILFPVQVQGLSATRAIAAGRRHSLALATDGTVWAWGDNYYGQLGDGTRTDRLVPVQVQGLRGIQALAAGGEHSLALAANGVVWAWGDNNLGQLGDGTAIERLAPMRVQGLSGVRYIAAGNGYSLALQECGQPWAWGTNYSGQLGDGTRTDRRIPVPILGFGGDGACQPVGLRVSLTGDGRGTVVSADADLHCVRSLLSFSDCIAVVDRDTSVILTATAEADSAFEGWAIDCQGIDPQTTVLMDRNKLCGARFRRDTAESFLLTVLGGGGRVTSSGGGILGPGHIDCGATCNAIFPVGTVVTLTTADANGFDFTGWSRDCSGTAPQTTVILDGPKTCRADFRPFELSVSVTGSGTVTSSPAGLDCGATCTFAPRTGTTILTATPAAGWQFDGWGGPCTGTVRQTSVIMDADKACTASFSRTPGLFFLTMIVEGQGSVTSTPPGIDCPSACRALYPAGTTVDLAAQATSTSEVSFWFDDCAQTGGLTNRIVMNADKQCRIRFVAQSEFPIAQFTFAPVQPRVGQVVIFDGNASCVFFPTTNTCDLAGIRSFVWDFENDGTSGASGSRSVAAIAQYAFQTPGDHSVRLRVVGGQFDAVADTLDVVPVRDAAGTLFGLTLSKAGTGQGNIVTDPPGLIRCNTTCTNAGPMLLEAGTVVTLTAEPRLGSSFVGWSGSGCASSNTSVLVSMDGARNCTATFTRNQFALTVNNGGSGRVTSNPVGVDCGPDCSETYDGGISVALTATPDSGFQVDSWTDCDAVSGNQCTVVMGSDRTVGVTFSPIPSQFTLTVVVDEQPPGSGSRVTAVQPATSTIDCTASGGPVCAEAFPSGVTVVLRPMSSRDLLWSGCDSVGGLFECTVTMTSNRTVTAVFR